MDVFQLFATSAAVFIVILLLVYFVCQLGPRASAWLQSTQEEKIGLSHKKLYHANGFLINSDSEFLLSSTGSFKRFDSVDGECKQHNSTSSSAGASPRWPQPTQTNIPGQPLRPAPSLLFCGTRSLEGDPAPQPHRHPIKQQSWAGRSSSDIQSPLPVTTTSAAIPRPIAHRQYSTPGRLPGIASPPRKLRSTEAVQLSRERRMNPFRDNAEQQAEWDTPEEGNNVSDSIAVVVATTSVTPSHLPDLVSDSLVHTSHRLSDYSDSESAPTHESRNPFRGDALEVHQSGFSGKLQETSLSALLDHDKHKQGQCSASESAPLIFNLENAPSRASAGVSVLVQHRATGAMSEGGYSTGGHKVLPPREDEIAACDERVMKARLLEVEGSIRKLECASGAVSGTTQALINNNQDVGFVSEMGECEDLSFVRRFRSHSETEASISLYGRLQRRRMIIRPSVVGINHSSCGSNSSNPFPSADLLQKYEWRDGDAGRNSKTLAVTGGASPRRSSLIRSSGMMIKQHLQQEIPSISANAAWGNVARSACTKPIVSAAVSCPSSAARQKMPLSRSIVQLLEEQGGPPSPTIPWASDVAVEMRGDESPDSAVIGRSKTNGRDSLAGDKQELLSDTSVIAQVNALGISCPGELRRAVSSDSVSWQNCANTFTEDNSSVTKMDSKSPPSVTGYLCIGLQLDRNNASEDGAELIVTLLEAKELVSPFDASPDDAMDTFVRIFLAPNDNSPMQTRVFPNSASPSYAETFSCWLSRERPRHSLVFHVYHSGRHQQTLIGEGELPVANATRPLTTWVPLYENGRSTSSTHSCGELQFSLSYLPTAERLTVVVIKGRSLQLPSVREQEGRRDSVWSDSQTSMGSPEADDGTSAAAVDSEASDSTSRAVVKVYLLKDGRTVLKQRTSLQRWSSNVLFDESMLFSLPAYMLDSVQVRLTVAQVSVDPEGKRQSQILGHVVVGCDSTDKGLRHWSQMLTSLRRPVAMWHTLQRCPGNKASSDTSEESKEETGNQGRRKSGL